MTGPSQTQTASVPDAPSPSRRRQAVAIFAILAFCFVICQFLRSALAVIAPDMMREASLTAADMGLITSTFFFAVAATQIPAGILFDRFGVRPTISLSLLSAIAGGFVFAYGQSFWAFALGQLLLGFGTSPVFMGTIVIIGRWFPSNRFATLSGLMMSLGYVGNLLATRPLAQLSELVGWRDAFASAAVLMVASTVLIMLFVRDAPSGHAWSRRQPESLASVVMGLREVLRHPIIIGLCGAAFIGYSTSFAVRGLWLGPYMFEVQKLDAIARGDVLFLFAILGTAGIFLAGWTASKFGSPRPVVIGAALIAASCTLSMALLNHPSVLAMVLVLSVFSLCSNFYPAVLMHGQATFPERLRGRSLTTVNFWVFAGVGITQVATGFIIDAFPGGPDGAHAEAAYRWMFAYLAATALIGVTLYVFIAKYRRPSPQGNPQ